MDVVNCGVIFKKPWNSLLKIACEKAQEEKLWDSCVKNKPMLYHNCILELYYRQFRHTMHLGRSFN